MNSATVPSVLLVYYSHTEQSRRVADVMAEVLRARGCEVSEGRIEFTDPRYLEKFARFPFKHAVFDLLSVLPAQTFRKTGEISIPEAARAGDYDLVCFGSPTWFFTTNMPLRSYLKSEEAGHVLKGKPFAAYVVCRRYWSINLREVKKLATSRGGTFVDGIRFAFAGGQIRSLLSLLSYFGKGEMRERSLGIRIPPTNLKPDFADQATAFANELADRLEERRPALQQPTLRGIPS
jgi:menaquinone-dependent protoporphyrinogen IX oxidase